MLTLPETCRFSYHVTKRMASFLISMIKFSRLHSQQTRDKDGVLFILCCCGINEDCRFIFSTSIFFSFFFLVTVWAASSLGKTEGFAEGCEAASKKHSASSSKGRSRKYKSLYYLSFIYLEVLAAIQFLLKGDCSQ